MKMLFILGYRRSATTALQTQVQAHPSVHYFNGGVRPDGRGRNEFHLFDLVDTAPAEYEALVRHHCGRGSSGDVTADAEAVFARCERPIGLVKSTRLLMSARAWDRFKIWAAATARQVWLLGIVRFPLDTLSSDNTTFAALAIPNDRVRRPDTAQDVWAESYQRLLDDTSFATAVRWLRVEDIIDQPREQIQDVAAWLGIEPYTRFVPWQPVNRDRWRTDPAFAAFTLHPTTRDIGRRFGYEL